ncbi:THAP domain-containing protein 2-like [Ostrinia nubilalis]|uniref:THAP domain-containing protein 2-like n=1 Tax=Ostrinia nubilalis TaxID=29057 RepID=UPI0030825B73
MPNCSVLGCGIKSENRISLHRFPNNEVMKKKWLEIIGPNNINPKHRKPAVCSMHFQESCINRTLDVTRLHDDALPSSSLLPNQTNLKTQQTPNQLIANYIGQHVDPLTSSEITKILIIKEESNTPATPCSQENPTSAEKIQLENKEIKYHKRCNFLKKRVKILQERVRRRDKKIALLTKIIKDIQQRSRKKNLEKITFQ